MDAMCLTSFAAAAAMAASPRVRGPIPVTVRRRFELPGIARVRLTFESPPLPIMPGCFAASACAAAALASASDMCRTCQRICQTSTMTTDVRSPPPLPPSCQDVLTRAPALPTPSPLNQTCSEPVRQSVRQVQIRLTSESPFIMPGCFATSACTAAAFASASDMQQIWQTVCRTASLSDIQTSRHLSDVHPSLYIHTYDSCVRPALDSHRVCHTRYVRQQSARYPARGSNAVSWPKFQIQLRNCHHSQH